MHVIDDGFQQCAVDYCIDEGDVQIIYKDSTKYAKDKLHQEVNKITENHAGIDIVYDTIRGIPSEEILKEQEAKGIDLIVIASHGKTGILKNLMGGVVDKVMKRAKCQVFARQRLTWENNQERSHDHLWFHQEVEYPVGTVIEPTRAALILR